METGNKIIILDFGSQYTKLIARRVRELAVFSEILPCDTPLDQLNQADIKGIILSGGPNSVFDNKALTVAPGFWDLKKPILGVCYGMQLMSHRLGGKVEASNEREYGPSNLELSGSHPLFKGFSEKTRVWMSHGDRLEQVPDGFRIVGTSENAPITAMVHEEKPLMGIQFHPEVSHTDNGQLLLKNFVFDICGCEPMWKMENYINQVCEEIRQKVGEEHVLLGLSGGVDSAVAAVLINKAIGHQLTCVFVDHGLMRRDERRDVEESFHGRFGIDLIPVDASDLFLSRLDGVDDPERKRKIIGASFVEVFEEEARKLPVKPRFLGQGTLYPDVIESAHAGGPAQTIKSHHNVGGLPEKMDMDLLEPLRELFKDEVREIGRLMGLPEKMVGRHPFPGPGLAVRIIGAIDRESIRILQEADAIFIESLQSAGLYDTVSQSFAVLLPTKTVGIMGDERTHEQVCVLRSVNTTDFMTADWSRLPYDFLAQVSARIVNEVAGINRVVYDITSKPPGTIEWE